jgi:hypothetical protein
MADPDKEQLEKELLDLQKQKTQAEIAILRRTTPLTELIKIFGSFVLGVGGAIAAIGGFQFAEIRAARSQLQADEAIKIKNQATDAAQQAKDEIKGLTEKKDQLVLSADQAQKNFATLSDKIQRLRSKMPPEILQMIEQDVNAADIELRASLPPAEAVAGSSQPLAILIDELFGLTASKRGTAYDQLMAGYSKSPALTPALLEYARHHMDNPNGIYNALVVLSHLDHQALHSDIASIRSFAEQARNSGPKTSERVDKLLQRLPH